MAFGKVKSQPPEKIVAGNLPKDTGTVASNIWSGLLYEELDPNRETRTLHNKNKMYREMQADPTISGALQGYENILSLVDWKVKQVDSSKAGFAEGEFDEAKAKNYRDFIETCFYDMAGTTVHDIVAAALDMLAMGFQVTVPQFKVRTGENDDPNLNSKHSDGKIGWKSWRVIRQESIESWDVPDGGGFEDLKGLVQRRRNASTQKNNIRIPRNRMLLFRTTSKGSNIEGVSILHGAVKTYRRKEDTLRIEHTALGRNLEGIPVLTMDSRYLMDGASKEEAKFRDCMIRQARSVHRNEQTCIVLPSNADDKGNKQVDLTLLTAGSNPNVAQCRTTAKDQEALIAESILANFMKLSAQGGSNAMASSLQDMFVLAMKKYLNNISSVINSEAIITLMKANGMDTRYAPYLDHEGLNTDSIGVYVDALVKLVQSGVIIPTKAIMKEVLERMKLSKDGSEEAYDEVSELTSKLTDAQARQAEADAKTAENPPAPTAPAPKEKTVTKAIQDLPIYEQPDGTIIQIDLDGNIIVLEPNE